MFEDPIMALNRSRDAFAEAVQDFFGQSVEENVYEPLEGALRRMQAACEQAELEQRQIQAMLLETRMIVV